MAVIRNWREQTPSAEGHGEQILWHILNHKDRQGSGVVDDPKAYCLESSLYDISRNAIQPGKRGSPPHSHEHAEQLFYILRGKGTMLLGEEEHKITEGDMIHLPPNTRHQISNGSDDWLEFLILSCRMP